MRFAVEQNPNRYISFQAEINQRMRACVAGFKG